MKSKALVSLASTVSGFFFFFTPALVHAGGVPVKAETQELFVPVGFDDNDEIVAVLDGYLPDSCHKLDAATIVVDPVKKKIAITQMARRWPGPCLFKIIPFTSTVPLGILPTGKYKIETNGGRLVEPVQIKEAQSAGPDDFLYAPVDTVSITPSGDHSPKKAVIEGRFTNTCMVFDRVIVNNSSKTLEVLPIIKLEARGNCEAKETSYRQEFNLPVGMTLGRHLLHVRSLNGRSLNMVFSVPDED